MSQSVWITNTAILYILILNYGKLELNFAKTRKINSNPLILYSMSVLGEVKNFRNPNLLKRDA